MLDFQQAIPDAVCREGVMENRKENGTERKFVLDIFRVFQNLKKMCYVVPVSFFFKMAMLFKVTLRVIFWEYHSVSLLRVS